jgi:outer membrane protein OmpA-like peptidoglycan-associated protein
VNRRPALRVDDVGIHAACCGANTWTATKGSVTVFINGKGAHRMGDQNRHCGGMGMLFEGSPNVIVGESGGGGTGPRSRPVASQPGSSSTNGAQALVAAAERDIPDIGEARPAPGAGDDRILGVAPPGSDDAVAPAAIDDDQIVVRILNAAARPQRDIDFTLTLPDREQKIGFTAADGCLRFSGLLSRGSCKLELLDFDVDDPRPAATTPGAIQCRRGGVTVRTGAESTVELPPRVYRGRLTGMLFDTDKVFLLPESMGGMQELVEYYAEHPDEEVLIIGHTDSQGSDDYNVRLSVERAKAMAEFLTDNTLAWLKRYRPMPVSDTWGVREDQCMLRKVEDRSKQPYRIEPPTDVLDDDTRDQIRRFQSDHDLDPTGRPDDRTRERLIERYMATDGTSLPGETTVKIHGCGPFHPAVDSPRGKPEQRNRRVEVLFFEGPVDPPPRTPCPHGGCPERQQWLDRLVETIDIGKPAGDLGVRVVDQDGAAIEGALVHIVGHSQREGATGANGLAPFARVISGEYRVTAEHDGFEGARRDAVTVSPGATAAVTLILESSRFELFADFNRSGTLTLTTVEHDARQQQPGAILLPDLDVNGRRLPGTVTPGPAATLDADAASHSPADPQLLDMVIKPKRGQPRATGELQITGPMSKHTTLLDKSARSLPAGSRPESSSVTLQGARTDLRVESKTLAGSPLSRTLTLSVDVPPQRTDEAMVKVELFTSAAPAAMDSGVFTISPLLFMHNLLPPERMYICETEGNEPTVIETRAAAVSIGLPLVTVPPSVSGDDCWLQDQFQVGYCQSPAGMMRVALHLPRTRANATYSDLPAENLRTFVDSHLPSRDLGLFIDFWKRIWIVKDANGASHPIPFDKSTQIAFALSRARRFRQRLREIVERVPAPGKPPSFRTVLAQIPDLFDKAKKKEGNRNKIDEGKASVDAETKISGPDRVRVTTKDFDIEFTNAGIDDLDIRLDVAHDSLNYGGNLQAAPPLAGEPQSKLVVGAKDKGRSPDPDLMFFLEAQRVQPLVKIDTSWLDVGHSDELMTFAPRGRSTSEFVILHAGPGLAFALVDAARSRWFDGLTQEPPDVIALQNTRLTTQGRSPVTHMLRGKQWLHHHPDNAAEPVLPPRIYRRMAAAFSPPDAISINRLSFTPGPGPDQLYPANLSVRELVFFGGTTNEDIDSSRTAELKGTLREQFPGVDLLELPVLFDVVDDLDNNTTSAFTPDMVNMQVIGDRLLIPRPYGPRMRPADALATVRAVVNARLEGNLAPAVEKQLTPQFISSKLLDRTLHWSNGDDQSFSHKNNGRNLTDLAGAFEDGFPELTGDSNQKARKERIRLANRGLFGRDETVPPGWHAIEIPEGMVDLFELYTEALLATIALKVIWIDSWFYHVRFGELHCGTNVLRRPPRNKPWWLAPSAGQGTAPRSGSGA